MDSNFEDSETIRDRRLYSILRGIYKNNPFYDWTLWRHVNFVAGMASATATELGGNGPIAFLAGLLHDIGAAMKGPEDHHKTGAAIAGKILTGLGYSEEIIKAVQYCILVHRGSIESERETIEAKCVASADGMTHFYQIPALFWVAFLKYKLSSQEAGEWLEAKLARDWKKMLPIHQKMLSKEHDAVIELFRNAPAW